MGKGTQRSFQDGDGPDSLIKGTPAADTLNGTSGDDEMYGYGGDDELDGLAGNDRMKGGIGTDSLYGGAGDDVLFGGDGSDQIVGQEGNDILRGDAGDDFLDGGEGVDTFLGGGGNDFISDNGRDALYDGGAGIDKLSLLNNPTLSGFTIDLSLTTAQFIYEGSTQGVVIRGIEDVVGGLFDDVVTGNNADNFIHVGSGNDTISGGGGNDYLVGSLGKDILDGGSGNDYLIGSEGSDTLSGGAGQDVFFIERAFKGRPVDTLLDFNVAQDTIELSNGGDSPGGFGFDLLGEGPVSADLFVANATGTAQDANDHLVYNTSNGRLYYDADGNGAAKAELFAIIGVNTHPALTAADFVAVFS